MEGVASLCPLQSFPSKDPAVFPQQPSHCGGAGMTCRLFCHKSALIYWAGIFTVKYLFGGKQKKKENQAHPAH